MPEEWSDIYPFYLMLTTLLVGEDTFIDVSLYGNTFYELNTVDSSSREDNEVLLGYPWIWY